MNGTARRVEEALDLAIQARSEFFVPSIVVHELWYGVAKSQKVVINAHKLSTFLLTQVETLAFDDADAQMAGEIRADLARRGTPIGPYDVLIAGQALARGLTLVTANTREFSRVNGLTLVDWTI
jgi:tRNA(fMet)-specific endonuclease VapC